jgi:uncharacterized BrkB/YihY/UPF0761 family membrane protein
MLRAFWTKFERDWGWNLARLLAYACIQMLFAVVGLQLIVLALALRFAPVTSQQQVSAELVSLLPDHITAAAVSAFQRSLRYAPVWLLILGMPIAFWYGTRFFVVLESSLCVIFRRRQRRFIAQNRVALLMMLLLAVLLPVIVLSTTLVPHVGLSGSLAGVSTSAQVGTVRLEDTAWLAALSFGASLAANFVLLLIAYMRVTPGHVPFRAAWPGALAGACLAQLYLLIFPLYVRDVLHPDHFGTVAGFVLVIVTFFFAYAVFIVLGAEVASWRQGYAVARQDIPAALADVALAESLAPGGDGTASEAEAARKAALVTGEPPAPGHEGQYQQDRPFPRLASLWGAGRR